MPPRRTTTPEVLGRLPATASGAVRALVLTLVAGLLALLGAHRALADAPPGTDPSIEIGPGHIPRACDLAATGPACETAAVAALDRARAQLGQPPYALPSDFVALSPSQQALILTDLDRGLYGLGPVLGTTATLGSDAARGLATAADPSSSDPSVAVVTSDFADGYVNLPYAYEAWMYDDGPGGANASCPSSGAAACWQHRHNILWRFPGSGPLEMGAAAGPTGSGRDGAAALLGQGNGGAPEYDYTWAQARADGAGATGSTSSSPAGGSRTSGAPADGTGASGTTGGSSGHGTATAGTTTSAPAGLRRGLAIRSLRVTGHAIHVRISAPQQAALRCALSTRVGRRWTAGAYQSCAPLTTFVHIHSGRYLLHVRSDRLAAARGVTVP